MSTACECKCHAGGPHATCDLEHDKGSSGVPGVPSCSPCIAPSAPVEMKDACVLGHPELVAREFGYACKRHYHWIDRTLVQIEELFALAGDVLVKVSGPMTGDGRGGTQTGSPAPGRIDLMAITDPRVAPRKERLSWYLNDDGRGGLESNGESVPDLPGYLAQWARMVVEERETTDEITGDVSQSVRVLRRERMWITRQPWLDDYAGELADLHRALARAVGDTMWPRPIGKCPNCAAPMYPTIGLDQADCRRCKTTWRGKDLARLRLIHEQEAS